MPETLVRRTFGDAYEVRITNDAREGYRVHIYRKDGSYDMKKVSNKEHGQRLISEIKNGHFPEPPVVPEIEPEPVTPTPKRTRRGT